MPPSAARTLCAPLLPPSLLSCSHSLSHLHPLPLRLSVSRQAMVSRYLALKQRGVKVGLADYAQRCGMVKSSFHLAVQRAEAGKPVTVKKGRPTALGTILEVRLRARHAMMVARACYTSHDVHSLVRAFTCVIHGRFRLLNSPPPLFIPSRADRARGDSPQDDHVAHPHLHA